MYSAFLRHPSEDPKDLQSAHTDPVDGIHRYFRTMGPQMQTRFLELVAPESIPVAFLHGNPHLDNYAKADTGTAMVDFDRARFGPYAYDIVRFLVSVSLKRKARDHQLAHPVVLESFRRGYLFGAHGLGHAEMDALAQKQPKKWQLSTNAYIESEKKWADRLVKHAIEPDERVQSMLIGYLESRGELDVLSTHTIVAAAAVPGSMGKMHTLVLLRPPTKKEDQRLVDIKETYTEEDDQWFRNPFAHQGLRMVRAGEVHAPGWELRPGWTSHDGVEYWCRQISPQQVKLRRPIDQVEQVDIAFSVASQLGRAHRASLLDCSAEGHLAHFESHMEEWIEIATMLLREVEVGHTLYSQALSKLELSQTG